jgi:hypothetical protein
VSDATEGQVSVTTLTFQADASARTPQSVTVTGLDDLLADGDVAYTVVLGAATSTDPAYAGQDPADVAATNRDDDSVGTISFTSTALQVSESAGSVTLTVQRSGSTTTSTGVPAPPVAPLPSGSVLPSASPVPAASPIPTSGAGPRPSALLPATVAYASANGTALAGQDYQAVSGTLAFAQDETTKTIVVPILIDSLVEAVETFTVTLSAPTGGAGLGQATVTVTIVDASAPPTGSPGAVPAPGSPGTTPELLPTPPSAVSPGDDSADDARVERERETEEERRQRERTNQGSKDDDSTEGNVVEARCDQPWPSVIIANRDGNVEVKLLKEAQKLCSSIQVGDYLEADGEKQHEQLFHADSVEIKRQR